jgi:hypothetical protein
MRLRIRLLLPEPQAVNHPSTIVVHKQYKQIVPGRQPDRELYFCETFTADLVALSQFLHYTDSLNLQSRDICIFTENRKVRIPL